MKYTLDDFKYDVAACDKILQRFGGADYILRFDSGDYGLKVYFYCVQSTQQVHVNGALYSENAPVFPTALWDVVDSTLYNAEAIELRDVEVIFKAQDVHDHMAAVRKTHPDKFAQKEEGS